MKRFGLMVVVWLVCAGAVFAAGDVTQPMYGWNVTVAGALLGIASPYITALFTKLHWAKWQKLLVLYVVSLVLTIGGGIFTGSITTAGIKGDDVIGIVTTILAVGKITYDWLNGSVKAVAVATEGENVNPT